jgi:hypothetical protein
MMQYGRRCARCGLRAFPIPIQSQYPEAASIAPCLSLLCWLFNTIFNLPFLSSSKRHAYISISSYLHFHPQQTESSHFEKQPAMTEPADLG